MVGCKDKVCECRGMSAKILWYIPGHTTANRLDSTGVCVLYGKTGWCWCICMVLYKPKPEAVASPHPSAWTMYFVVCIAYHTEDSLSLSALLRFSDDDRRVFLLR